MNLPDLLFRLPQIRVLVIGDAMLDHYLWGDITRISPEAPVPVVHVAKETFTAGGAANVALNLASLGVQTELIGTLGDDTTGTQLRELLAAKHVQTGHCPNNKNAPTIIKTRVVARTQQVCRIDREAARSHYDLFAAEAHLRDYLSSALKHVDAVILSDYAKGVITQELIDFLTPLAAQHKVLLAVDPKPSRKLNYSGVGLMTPNRHEALELAGIPEPHHDEPYPLEQVCQRIHAQFSPRLLVVTLGADGMAISQNGAVAQTLPTEAREVFDVSGAGDTVIATLTAALAAGADPVQAARTANRAAGIVVSKVGTVTVTPEEMLEAA